MSGLIKNIYSKILNNFSIRPTVTKLNKVWYGQSEKATSEDCLVKRLQERFPNAKEIKVVDVSGGCGAMYEIYVESSEFKGLSIVKQHRTITDTLKEEIKLIHGLRIETKVA